MKLRKSLEGLRRDVAHRRAAQRIGSSSLTAAVDHLARPTEVAAQANGIGRSVGEIRRILEQSWAREGSISHSVELP
ncbi:MAG: hypothetical protein IPH13_08935 [Planctomycetes bacterium]|nr:hypothetical protein [Planctomycetota bacterium]MCC7172271.1 hypothetical protein [Planctomycetota bacterium]